MGGELAENGRVCVKIFLFGFLSPRNIHSVISWLYLCGVAKNAVFFHESPFLSFCISRYDLIPR